MSHLSRRRFLQHAAGQLASATALGTLPAACASSPTSADDARFQVGAYYFPNYHVDPRNETRYGKRWTEWELVKAAQPRFENHRQPRVPMWGYVDEADPAVMEMKIDAAADHGLDYWIFDWYWYDDGPFLDRCLERGYFGAANNQRVKFCCMWANHDWTEIFPAHRGKPHKLLYPGAVTRVTFDRIADHVIGRYFKHPAHFSVDGRPYFSIYDVKQLIDSFGGLDPTRRVLDAFRKATQQAGFPGLHLNAVMWGAAYRDKQGKTIDHATVVRRLGFDSVTSYVWVHHVPLPTLTTDYATVQDKYFTYWDEALRTYSVPYYPNVSVGWDPSPRTDPTDPYGNYGYPFTNTITGNTPARFRQALQATRKRLLANNGPWILNINSWNEWTEGSYLEPDTMYKMGYLDAVRDVFGK